MPSEKISFSWHCILTCSFHREVNYKMTSSLIMLFQTPSGNRKICHDNKKDCSDELTDNISFTIYIITGNYT